ncbi:MAG: hypothetical protein ABEJ04_07305 [Halobacteriaceae archaeon]
MRVAAIPGAVTTAVGTLVTVYTGYLVVRGPFFGGAVLDPVPLMVALGGFLVGVMALAWGTTSLVRNY